MRNPLRLASIFFIWIILSCALLQPMPAPPPTLAFVTVNPNASPTPTPFQAAEFPSETPTLVYTFTPEPPTDTPLPTLEYTATTLPQPTAPVPSTRTQYTIYALLDYSGHQLGADETIRYTNQTGITLGEVVMAVEPNLRGGFTIENIMLDGNLLNYALNGHHLIVTLTQGLAPGAQITLTMRFRIDIPAKVKDKPYGFDVDQVNLTDWYPFIVPFSNGWVLHDPSYLGEYLVYDSADFEVNVKTTQTGVVI